MVSIKKTQLKIWRTELPEDKIDDKNLEVYELGLCFTLKFVSWVTLVTKKIFFLNDPLPIKTLTGI